MFKTTTVSELRSDLATLIKSLDDGPIVVLSHSRPAAVLVDPELFETLLEKCELIEDFMDGRRVLSEYMRDRTSVVDAEEVFDRLGL